MFKDLHFLFVFPSLSFALLDWSFCHSLFLFVSELGGWLGKNEEPVSITQGKQIECQERGNKKVENKNGEKSE